MKLFCNDGASLDHASISRAPWNESHQLSALYDCAATINASCNSMHTRRLRARLACEGGNGLLAVALGSSVECGRGLNLCNGKKGRGRAILMDCHADAFPARLELALNTFWPCANSSHRVISMCGSGFDSAYWTRRLRVRTHQVAQAALKADWVLIETAITDGFPEAIKAMHGNAERTPDGCSTDIRAAQNTEALVRVLSTLPERPALTYVDATWRPQSSSPYYASAADLHRPTMTYYGVPHVKMISGWASTFEPAALRSAVSRLIHVDKYGHLNHFGHNLTASVLLHLVRSCAMSEVAPCGASCKYNRWGYLPSELLTRLGSAREPHRCDVDFSGFGERAEVVDLWNETAAAPLLVFNDGFRFGEDVPGRPGLLADRPGAHLLLRLPTTTLRESALLPQPCTVSIGFLSSHEQVGVFIATVYPNCENDVVDCTGQDVDPLILNSTDAIPVDARNNDGVSIYRSIQAKSAAQGCLGICVGRRLGKAAAAGREHKVKLLDLAVLCPGPGGVQRGET